MSTATSPWLSAWAAANRVGISVTKLQNMAIAGLVRTKVEPGSTPRYHAEDIDRLAEERKASVISG
jgi:predicted site-specific integrase-resolvase